jgi:hypothetical protein
MSEGDLGGILNRTLKTTCEACGAELPPRTRQCTECGAAISDDDEEEESRFNVVSGEPSGGPAGGGKRSIPLERARNYIAMRDAAEGAVSGEMSDDAFRAVLQKMKTVATTGLKVLQSDVARARFGSLPDHERAAAERMERGFVQLQEGTRRMEAWLTGRNPEDIREGWREAERGWIDIDAAQEEALRISEERET